MCTHMYTHTYITYLICSRTLTHIHYLHAASILSLLCCVCVFVSGRYKWGSVTHQSVGDVRNINKNGTDVSVDFPEQKNWTGLISEMELVPGVHPRHK